MQHKIDLHNNRQTIIAAPGDTIEIELEENPTTGYSWAVEQVDPVLSLQKSDYQLPDSAAIGGGGIRTMVFKVEDEANAHIRLKYWQRWSGDTDKVFELGIKPRV